jgi:DNA-binding MarR family transcriptional regulator
MSPAPPLTQFIGRTERALGALMDLVLADTGGTFHQWLALNFTAVNGESVARAQLSATVANAVRIDESTADAVITELLDEGLLEAVSGSFVAFTDSGRERYARIRATIDQTTAPLYADLPPGDLATARRVLTTISERADIQLARV